MESSNKPTKKTPTVKPTVTPVIALNQEKDLPKAQDLILEVMKHTFNPDDLKSIIDAYLEDNFYCQRIIEEIDTTYYQMSLIETAQNRSGLFVDLMKGGSLNPKGFDEDETLELIELIGAVSQQAERLHIIFMETISSCFAKNSSEDHTKLPLVAEFGSLFLHFLTQMNVIQIGLCAARGEAFMQSLSGMSFKEMAISIKKNNADSSSTKNIKDLEGHPLSLLKSARKSQ